MPRNIEIKARVDGVDALVPGAAALASEGPFEIDQDDTFFRCSAGRLKLRDFRDGTGELIFYRRSDGTGAKESFYVRSPTTAPAALRDALALAYGESGRVVKRRTLFLAGRTRIHLDRVAGLGEFVELEVVLREGEPAAAGIAEANEVMERLGVEPHRLVAGAYVDLMASARLPVSRAAAVDDFEIAIVPCRSVDEPGWLALRRALWPSGGDGEHRSEMASFLREPARFLQCIARDASGRAVGFVEASIRRDHVNGTTTSPVAFLEGLYVAPDTRRRGIAARLVAAVATWALARGCTELASDTGLENAASRAVHEALGLRETERTVYFVKALR